MIAIENKRNCQALFSFKSYVFNCIIFAVKQRFDKSVLRTVPHYQDRRLYYLIHLNNLHCTVKTLQYSVQSYDRFYRKRLNNLNLTPFGAYYCLLYSQNIVKLRKCNRFFKNKLSNDWTEWWKFSIV